MGRTPPWQDDPCPAWCVSEHDADDLPEDRFHDSSATSLPVIVRGRLGLPRTRGVDVVLTMTREAGTREDWLHVSAPEAGLRGFTLTAESARRLGQALIEATDSAGAT
ncbi:hypothetical protein NODU109028_15730 [Nocardioides dubius]|uniref:Uncharacterized protein n=1 Tax=Nocardioides dubius TaxID=317019 RepID=A0ABN1U270_9ACTN